MVEDHSRRKGFGKCRLHMYGCFQANFKISIEGGSAVGIRKFDPSPDQCPLHPSSSRKRTKPTNSQQTHHSTLFPQDPPPPGLGQFRIRHLPIPRSKIRRPLYPRNMRRRIPGRFRALTLVPKGMLQAPLEHLVMFPLPSRVWALGHGVSSQSSLISLALRIGVWLRRVVG